MPEFWVVEIEGFIRRMSVAIVSKIVVQFENIILKIYGKFLNIQLIFLA